MPHTKLNKNWVCFVWADGAFRLWNEPRSIRGIRHKGQRPLFAYGSKYNSVWLRSEARAIIHPVNGKYIEVEPFIEEIIQDLVLTKVTYIHTPSSCARDLKYTFTG